MLEGSVFLQTTKIKLITDESQSIIVEHGFPELCNAAGWVIAKHVETLWFAGRSCQQLRLTDPQNIFAAPLLISVLLRKESVDALLKPLFMLRDH